MARGHKAKTGGTGRALAILQKKADKKKAVVNQTHDNEEDDDSTDDIQNYKDKKGNLYFDKVNQSDDEDDEEVLDLAEDSDDEDDQEDEDDENDDEEDDYDDEDQDDDLHKLVKNLAPNLRSRILSGRVNAEDDDDDLIEKTDKLASVDKTWGKKKAYYDADAGDLEGEDELNEAEEEEAEAKVSSVGSLTLV